MSNVLDIQAKEFDADSYTGEDLKPEVVVDEMGKEHVRARPQDVIRWRYAVGPDGNVIVRTLFFSLKDAWAYS